MSIEVHILESAQEAVRVPDIEEVRRAGRLTVYEALSQDPVFAPPSAMAKTGIETENPRQTVTYTNKGADSEGDTDIEYDRELDEPY